MEQARRVRTSDDDLAELADRLPGFGGYYYDEQQRLTVWLKEPGRAAEAQAEMANFLRKRAGRAREWAEENAARANGMRVRQAQYDFRQLLTWYRGHVLPNVMRLEGITMTDIDDRVNRIQVGVASTAYVESTRAFLERLPLPDGVVEVVVEAAAVPATTKVKTNTLASSRFTTQSLLDTLRPVPGGARIRIYDSEGHNPCTLGFNLVAWQNSQIQTPRYFVTNSHCASLMGQVDSLAAAQPVAGQFIGYEVVDPPSFDCFVVLTLTFCNRLADAALFLYDSPSDADHGKVAVPGTGQTTFSTTTAITEVFAPELQRSVEMIGATSGRRAGTVSRICADLVLYYPEDGFQIVRCSGRANYESGTYDSGAPVIERLGDGSVAYGVGIHFAGSPSYSWFSPLYSVLNDLYDSNIGVLDPTTSPTSPPSLPSPPTGFEVAVYGMTLVGPTTICTWTAVVTGGQSPFEYSWSGPLTGSDSYVIGGLSESAYVWVTVNDALGIERTAGLLVEYDPEAELDCM